MTSSTFCCFAFVLVALWVKRKRLGPRRRSAAGCLAIVPFVGGPMDGARWYPVDDPPDGLPLVIVGRGALFEYEYDREFRRLDLATVHPLAAIQTMPRRN